MTDTAPNEASAFWQFSLRFYARPGVAEACLQLQDEHDVDVNILLYALYVARAGRVLDASDVVRMQTLVTPWRERVVRPLREARRFTKTPPAAFADTRTAALRADIKRIELAAEQLQQHCLERDLPVRSLGSAHPDMRACAISNVAAYAKALGDFPAAPVKLLLSRFDDM